tara:strand:+ start:11266 stop:11514 length:249 start_codon:yes stop_codon:yes gene_type:complete
MKLIAEECLISKYGVSCFKPTLNKPSFFIRFLNNNVKIISNVLTNEYIFGYICFRGCEFIIKDFLDNKDTIFNSSSYEYLSY